MFAVLCASCASPADSSGQLDNDAPIVGVDATDAETVDTPDSIADSIVDSIADSTELDTQRGDVTGRGDGIPSDGIDSDVTTQRDTASNDASNPPADTSDADGIDVDVVEDSQTAGGDSIQTPGSAYEPYFPSGSMADACPQQPRACSRYNAGNTWSMDGPNTWSGYDTAGYWIPIAATAVGGSLVEVQGHWVQESPCYWHRADLNPGGVLKLLVDIEELTVELQEFVPLPLLAFQDGHLLPVSPATIPSGHSDILSIAFEGWNLLTPKPFAQEVIVDGVGSLQTVGWFGHLETATFEPPKLRVIWPDGVHELDVPISICHVPAEQLTITNCYCSELLLDAYADLKGNYYLPKLGEIPESWDVFYFEVDGVPRVLTAQPDEGNYIGAKVQWVNSSFELKMGSSPISIQTSNANKQVKAALSGPFVGLGTATTIYSTEATIVPARGFFWLDGRPRPNQLTMQGYDFITSNDRFFVTKRLPDPQAFIEFTVTHVDECRVAGEFHGVAVPGVPWQFEPIVAAGPVVTIEHGHFRATNPDCNNHLPDAP